MPGYWKIHFDNTQCSKNEQYEVHIHKSSTSYHHEPLKIVFWPTERMKKMMNCGLTEYLRI